MTDMLDVEQLRSALMKEETQMATKTTVKTTTGTDGKVKHTFNMSAEEIKAELQKLQDSRDRAREQRKTPEFQAAQKARQEVARQKRAYIKAQAAKLGLALK